MKILESAPRRYDAGIRIITLGRLDAAYDRLISCVQRGQRVLDIGCGTGALALRAAQKGAHARGVDPNRQMLEVAQEKADRMKLSQNVEFCEMGVAELDGEKSGTYDVVMSGLCFSELTNDELKYTLKEIKRILKPNGILLVADEVRPESFCKRVIGSLIRFPLVLMAYVITQTTSRAIENLPKMMKTAGFRIESLKLNRMGNFIELICTDRRK